ncbi:uncharacterized protein LOC144542164 [Centroberyx gerrardi]
MVSLYYCIFSLLSLTILTSVSCEEFTPVKNEEDSLEGSTVTLSYKYSKPATAGDNFFWYRQYPGKPPEFLLYISGLGSTRAAESLKSDTRFSTKLAEGKRGVDLEISSAAVTDSALYYCAVYTSVTMLLHLIWLIIFTFHAGSSEDLIKPFKDVMLALEGDRVTLSCNYSVSVKNLFWYRQYSSSSPQLLIMEYSQKIPGLSFKQEKERKEFHLEISSAAVTDSALYYCALQPTVTGNPESLYKNSPTLFLCA